MTIFEKAAAKINLSLDVLGKRDDGFHEVEMIMTMVDLADRIELRELESNQIVISSQAGFVPLDEKNLAYQAASLIKSRYNVQRGVYINLDKKIPVSAGLAGGSSDAAATLRGLNRLWKLNISSEELQELGAQIGSDVPFCVTGGTAVASGRGEKLRPITSRLQCWVVLAKPQISVSTSEIYGKFNLAKISKHPGTAELIDAIQKGQFGQLCASLDNVLEEVTLPLYPEVKRLKDCMRKLGAEGVLMSGSGPTIFGLVSKQSKVAGIYNGLKGFCKDVYAVRMLP